MQGYVHVYNLLQNSARPVGDNSVGKSLDTKAPNTLTNEPLVVPACSEEENAQDALYN